MTVFFSKMIGTLAVIILIAAYIGGSDLISKFYFSWYGGYEV